MSTFVVDRLAAERSIRRESRRGAMLVLIAAMLVLFMVFIAFAIDVAHMHLAKAELRSATDAAAKAAAQELSRTQDIASAIRVGTAVAAENKVNNVGLQLSDSDFVFGRSVADNVTGRFVFSGATIPMNSVQVSGRRTQGSRSGVVPLIFGSMFGVPFFEPEEAATATYLDRDVVLVVDRSGSMSGRKIADLRSAIDVFVTTLSLTPVNEFVGLASYSSAATADAALTQNLTVIADKLRRLPIAGMTNITSGLVAGEDVFRTGRPRQFVERTMIVMTDGLHNTGPEPRGAAARLAADGVVIHTITFGNDADRTRMQEVARIGGGRHFHADNGLQLQQVYREIALSLSTMITE